jgi:hypothetical protein
MKAILFGFAAIVLMVFVACGGDDATCSSDKDCADVEDCLWVTKDGHAAGQMCIIRCATDTECPAGSTCTGEAHSCPTCKDFIRICQ